MSKRRTHSSLDYLPESLRETITRMVTDGYWPDECGDDHKGKPTYDDITEYIVMQGHSASRSAVGRWAKQLLVYEKMNLSRDLARQIMSGVDSESSATETQKAAAEMMTAQIIDVVTTGDLDAKEIAMISGAIRDCTQVAMKADQYIRAQIAERVKTASEKIGKELEGVPNVQKAVQSALDEILMGTKK